MKPRTLNHPCETPCTLLTKIVYIFFDTSNIIFQNIILIIDAIFSGIDVAIQRSVFFLGTSPDFNPFFRMRNSKVIDLFGFWKNVNGKGRIVI